MGKFSHKNWSSPNWLKSGTDINCFILVSNSMLIFLIFFHSYFLGQIWSQNLKFSKLTEIWYQGTLLYVYHNFSIYFCNIFVVSSFFGKSGTNLVPNSLIVNSFFCITMFKLLRASSRSSLDNTVVESLENLKICSIIKRDKYFFNCYLPAPRTTLGLYWGDSLTQPMLITVFYIFDLKVIGSLVVRLGPIYIITN